MNVKLAIALGLAIAVSSPVYASSPACPINGGPCKGSSYTPVPPSRCNAVCRIINSPFFRLDRRLGRK